MASPDPRKAKKKTVRRRRADSAGLRASDLTQVDAPSVQRAREAVEAWGGQVLTAFSDPLGGKPQVLAALPLAAVTPSAFQRDLSDAHVKKLMGVFDRLQQYLDPIVVVVDSSGNLRSPNGHHRLEAMKRLGGRSIVALVVPDSDLEYQILALNTEKAPGLKDRSLEAIRLARTLSTGLDPVESDFAAQFEEPAHLTLGLAYEHQGRFSGSAYHPVLKQMDGFLDQALSITISIREGRAKRLLELDQQVKGLVKALEARGFESPYLKTWVIAQIRPRAPADFDEGMTALEHRVETFDPTKIEPSQLASGVSED